MRLISGRISKLLVSAGAECGGQGFARHNYSMTFRKHEKFPSKILKNERDLVVYLPPGYEDQGSRRFPVLYLHDGQNLFDGSTAFVPGMDWRVGETADHMIGSGAVEPLIIVGIYNLGEQRIREYTPTRVPKLGGGTGRSLRQIPDRRAEAFHRSRISDAWRFGEYRIGWLFAGRAGVAVCRTEISASIRPSWRRFRLRCGGTSE